jgi:multiple antibiotic resistance protein
VQVGGGLVVASTGWSLLNRNDNPREPAARAKASTEDLLKHAFYPLTLPLTVGPGSISVAITLGANLNAGGLAWEETAAAAAGLAVVAWFTWVCYSGAERMARVIGETGTSVVVRLSSFILLCIGVQILWNGVAGLMQRQ